METFFTKRVIAVFLIVGALGIGILIFFVSRNKAVPEPLPVKVEIKTPSPAREVIGKSVEGREIEALTYGSGKTRLMFVGGIHGGYEWNSVLLAYTFMDYLKANSGVVPVNLSVTVIPDANPDGVFKGIGKEGRFTVADAPKTGSLELARFNAHRVDLNRNFDCKWQAQAMWKGTKVSAGTAAFSEPEARAIRDYVLGTKPSAVVFWHSQANAVYASQCEKGILPDTLNIMNAYAKAAEYQAVKSFDAYAVTGDAEGWLASIGIPAITVELKTHETIEWEKNLAGIKALFKHYSKLR